MDLKELETLLESSGFSKSFEYTWMRDSLDVMVKEFCQYVRVRLIGDSLSLYTEFQHTMFLHETPDAVIEEALTRFVRFSSSFHSGIEGLLTPFSSHSSWMYDMIGNDFKVELLEDEAGEYLLCNKRVGYDRVYPAESVKKIRDFRIDMTYRFNDLEPVESEYTLNDHDGYPSMVVLKMKRIPEKDSFVEELEYVLREADRETRSLLQKTDFSLRSSLWT